MKITICLLWILMVKIKKELTPYKGVKVNIIEMLKEDKDHMIISMNKNNAEVFDPYKINIKNGKLSNCMKTKTSQIL